MCITCGCGTDEVHIDGKAHGHGHGQSAHGNTGHANGHDAPMHADHHGHAPADAVPGHAHAPGLDRWRRVRIEEDILGKNNAYAARNRAAFEAHAVFALNLVSSPGSGKTTLLCRTIEKLKDRLPLAVIEGDQQTSHDAERIRASGAVAVQINTGKGCHLDAHMIGHALERLVVPEQGVLFIENVGNLVCPAGFDLGEAHKVVILSVTEGEDKPLKYPDMFRAADVMLLNKTDLLPHVSFDAARCVEYAQRVNPALRIIQTSATAQGGLDAWIEWIVESVARVKARAAKPQGAADSRAAPAPSP
jgi:hydrogenase nickel incorporation protein HypB